MFDMVRALAANAGMADQVAIDATDLGVGLREGRCFAYLAYDGQQASPVGYALGFFTFSSWTGRGSRGAPAHPRAIRAGRLTSPQRCTSRTCT